MAIIIPPKRIYNLENEKVRANIVAKTSIVPYKETVLTDNEVQVFSSARKQLLLSDFTTYPNGIEVTVEYDGSNYIMQLLEIKYYDNAELFTRKQFLGGDNYSIHASCVVDNKPQKSTATFSKYMGNIWFLGAFRDLAQNALLYENNEVSLVNTANSLVGSVAMARTNATLPTALSPKSSFLCDIAVIGKVNVFKSGGGTQVERILSNFTELYATADVIGTNKIGVFEYRGISIWKAGKRYFNDDANGNDDGFIDVVYYEPNGNYYKCQQTHTSTTSITPMVWQYWEVLDESDARELVSKEHIYDYETNELLKTNTFFITKWYEGFGDWRSNELYSNSDTALSFVIYAERYFMCVQTHTSAFKNNPLSGDGALFWTEISETVWEEYYRIGGVGKAGNIDDKIKENTKKWKNGRETAHIRCSLNDFYDTVGNLVISPMSPYSYVNPTFTVGDEVIVRKPNYNGIEASVSYYADGTEKIFIVTAVEFENNGALWQTLDLLEKPQN